MLDCIESICFSEEEIADIVKKLGKEITKDYDGKNPLVIGLLKGCIPFMSDLFKNIDTEITLGYMKVSSYKGTESTGTIKIDGSIPDVKGRHVIVVDDILDTGRTLNAIKNVFMDNGALSVEVCVLLDKPEGRKVNIVPKYCGGKVPNAFVVGYGLDYEEHYRNLPYIGILKKEIYS
ncbi:MAG: hypoxanthine phosphoribosyltransferase [Acholeplasmatales bacterium]|nr:hypoxanthine phosphoribosyltransferase [Acholeplasmatales bacterium]